MVECGLWLPQVIPQVKIVFGRKSLDDMIPGSWYSIPLPSTREARYRISILLRIPSMWGFLGRMFACLMCWVCLKLILVLQGIVLRECSGDHDEEVMNRIPDRGATEGWAHVVRIQKYELNNVTSRQLISAIRVAQRKRGGPITHRPQDLGCDAMAGSLGVNSLCCLSAVSVF